MNVLPLEKRLDIVRLKAAGATLREIAATVGSNRQTVANYIGRNNVRRRKMSKALDLLGEQIMALGTDPLELDAYLALIHMIDLECPLHPEAEALEDVNEGGCRLCRSDGLKRHHARRKAEGRPIIPPRPRKKSTL